jgi:hypothetical protein
MNLSVCGAVRLCGRIGGIAAPAATIRGFMYGVGGESCPLPRTNRVIASGGRTQAEPYRQGKARICRPIAYGRTGRFQRATRLWNFVIPEFIVG